MSGAIEYLPDAEVDESTDRQIRSLLVTCFTKPEDEVFQHRRYFIQPYPYRWVIRGADNRPIAHVGVHDKAMQADGRTIRFGGIAEVCVHPDFRGRGYVKAMLSRIHPWLAAHGFTFAILFGDPDVYGSSGYRVVGNILMAVDPALPDAERESVEAMIRPLTGAAWPETTVFIPGPHF